MRGNLAHQDRAIVDYLRSAPVKVIAVYRFGSTVDGASTRESDTDVAVLLREPLSAATWFDLQAQLAATLGCTVDLFELATASPVMAMQVITRGRLLYDDDSAMRGLFEDHAFGAYARLNEERRGILERIAAEGTIYGR